jgi:hypothetical protein
LLKLARSKEVLAALAHLRTAQYVQAICARLTALQQYAVAANVGDRIRWQTAVGSSHAFLRHN